MIVSKFGAYIFKYKWRTTGVKEKWKVYEANVYNFLYIFLSCLDNFPPITFNVPRLYLWLHQIEFQFNFRKIQNGELANLLTFWGQEYHKDTALPALPQTCRAYFFMSLPSYLSIKLFLDIYWWIKKVPICALFFFQKFV